jgi:protein SCO1/2
MGNSKHREFESQALACLVLITLLLTACGAYQFKGSQYPDTKAAPDFQLNTADGQSFQLSQQQGKVVLVFFGYTSCPDVCPITLAQAHQILQGLGSQADKVTFLFITVDPERDTPAVLSSYTKAFDPAIVGLTGTPEELQAVYRAYGIVVEKAPPEEGSAGGYSVTHTARIFLVDSQGNLFLSYSYGTPVDDIVQDVRHLVS